ncbi:MAG: type II toxin-antitoxin system RatA family toxin [Micropepsaceae bacterium]
MARHSEKRVVPYTDEQMFALVADVERYPEFLPWCAAVRIRSREITTFTADLIAAFGVVRERFTSRVMLDPGAKIITIEYIEGPFEHLTNVWRFNALTNGCEVDFDIDFRFKSRALEVLISGVFTRAVEKMTRSFVARADELYASGNLPS